MDKVKLALEMLKKYHFWVLCSVAIVVILLCWTWATADLASRFDKRKGELDQHFNATRQILSNPSLRNEGSVKATQDEHSKQKDQVLDGWKLLYQQQKGNNPLPAVLGDDFRLHFEALQPGQEMHDRFRERYLNFIGRHYPTLLRLVDIYRPSDVPLDEYTDALRGSGSAAGRGGSRRGPMGGGAGFGEEMGMGRPARPARTGRPGEAVPEADPWQGLVEWPQPEIFDITAGWEQTPTTQQVLLAQEDLWVYEALLRIINNVNAGVETHEKAWIKRIDALEIGRPAAEAWGANQEPIFAEPAAATESSAGGGMGEGMGMEGGMGETAPGMGMGGMGGGMGEMGGELGGSGMGRQDNVNLLDGRYVDESGRPLLAQEFETQPPYAEFKMMMVHMNLFMHQRRIPKLLVECANSAMPIEVIRLRINPGEGGPTALGEVEGGRGSARGNRGMGRPTRRPQIIREGGMGGGVTSTQDDEHDYANVEVFGIIYIYNPPDVTKLGTGAASDEQGEQAVEGEPMQPGAQPATPAAPTTPATPETPAAPETPTAPTAPATPATPPPGAEPAGEPSPAPPATPAPATPAPATPAPATPAAGPAPGAPNP